MREGKSIRVRQLVRWSLQSFLALMATAVGLIVADSLHRRTCRASDLAGIWRLESMAGVDGNQTGSAA